MKQKHSFRLLAGLATVLGIIYIFRSFSYYYGDIAFSYASTSMGVQLARYFILPHLLCTLLAVSVNVFGFMQSRNRFAFAASLIYIVAIILFPRATPHLLPSSILSIISCLRTSPTYTNAEDLH